MTTTSATAEDPFDCFGDDDDDSDSDDESSGNNSDGGRDQDPNAKSETSSSSSLRDPVCGVLTFHRGTEQSLCHYVQQAMETLPTIDNNNDGNSNERTAVAHRVLKCIDQFCYTRHWMMHVGDQKGLLLKEFVLEFCQHQQERLSSTSRPVTIVELGTYCGYSSILMAQTILESGLPDNNNNNNFHIYSVDVDPHHHAVAQKLVQMAQLEQYITFVLVDNSSKSLVHALQERMESNTLGTTTENNKGSSSPPPTIIDFLFIDHDKDLYCSDLQQLEQSGMVQPGTHVAADNVVFFDIPYRSYIQKLKDQGIVSSRLVMGQLEYIIEQELLQGEDGSTSPHPATEAARDGIGKFQEI